MQRSAGEVPEAVLFEILIRLPVKSLCRFRSVSTVWLSVISGPYFIRSHYALSKTSLKLVLNQMSPDSSPSSSSLWELLVSDEDCPEPPEATVTLQKRFPEIWYFPLRGWMQSVHGLVCIPGDSGISILNPSTQEYISIHFPPFPRISTYEYEDHHYFFGFDPVADKHKVLFSFATFHWTRTTDSPNVIEHWVFTLGSAEKWRRIRPLNSDYHRIRTFRGEVCINGVVYFRSDKSKLGAYMVSFDFKSESFQTVKLSLPVPWELGCYDLIEFNGSVALASNCLDVTYRRPDKIHLLVLEDFNKQIWKLERSVPIPENWLDIIEDQEINLECAPRSGNLLVFTPYCRVPSSSYLYCYDVRSNRFWSSKIHVPEHDQLDQSFWVALFNHVECLLPVKDS